MRNNDEGEIKKSNTLDFASRERVDEKQINSANQIEKLDKIQLLVERTLFMLFTSRLRILNNIKTS